MKRHSFSTWALGKGRKSVLRPGAFSPHGRVLSTYLIGLWMGPQSQSGSFREVKHLVPLLELEPGSVGPAV
jgi:hypothetical protein